MSRRVVRLIAILIFSSAQIDAQQPIYSYAKLFKVEDGLPQSFISGIQQDQDGFLWIGTRDGLARYDGRGFKIFRHNPGDSNSLSSSVIMSIFRDSHNQFWITHENGLLDCFDPRSFSVRHAASIPWLSPHFENKELGLVAERNNIYWIVPYLSGVRALDAKTGKMTRYTAKSGNAHSDSTLALSMDDEGRVWTLYRDGIAQFDPGNNRFRFIPFPSSLKFLWVNEIIHPTTFLSNGKWMIADGEQIIVYDTRNNQFEVIPFGKKETGIDGPIRTMLRGPDSLLYTERPGAVFRLEKNGSMSYIWDYPNKAAHFSQGILIDRSQVMWFGTNAGGLYKVDLASIPFTSSRYDGRFHVEMISRIPGLNKEMLPALFRDDRSSYHFRYHYAKDGSLYFLNTSDQITKPGKIYYVKNAKIQSFMMPAMDKIVLGTFCVDREGRFQATDIYNTLYRWDDPGSLPIVKKIDTKLVAALGDMEPDEDGSYWGVTEGGLYQFKADTIFRRFINKPPEKNFPADRLTDMLTDPENKNWLWIGTLGQGLVLFYKNTGVKKIFTQNDGLPNNTIYAIVPDNQGRLWLSTNKGICMFDRKTYSCKNFDINDGLPENEFNRFHSFKFPNGNIGFGGSNGFTIFDPSKFTEDNFPTVVRITGISINNKPIELSDQHKIFGSSINEVEMLTLPYNKNFLGFEFAGLQFNQPGRIQYRYRLKGYDKDWIVAGERNLATYTKLPPGHYTLMLNASNTSGKWSPDIKQLRIRIKPPAWATWWAYSIYALIIVGLIRIYWNYRSRRIQMQNEIALEQSKAQHLKEVDEIKNRFFSNITHELRTPLTLILTPIEQLRQKSDLEVSDMRVLDTVHRNAGQLLKLINELLDISKIESGQMSVNLTVGEPSLFFQNCIHRFSAQAKEKNIDLQFHQNGVEGHFLFDEDKWEKIVFNLLSNAIKFTPASGVINLDLKTGIDQKGRTTLLVRVSDSGPGITVADQEKIFDRFYMVDDSATRKLGGTGIGLSLVKELTELMGGKVSLDSTPGRGSLFQIEIPVEKIKEKEQVPVEQKLTGSGKQITTVQKEAPLILVVEDNDELLAFISGSLSINWRIIEASNGKNAWKCIVEEMPDLIISDLMMPEMDGLELCQLVKDDARTGHIPFLLLTAKAAHESRLAGLKKGADEYLTKPFHLDELDQKLHNLVDQQERLKKHLLKELFPEAPFRKLPHVNNQFIQELYKQLDIKIENPMMSVELIAKSMSLSQRTLNRKLKAILNISPVDFIRKYRLQKAAILLSSGHAIADTAYSVGFETPSYFSQCFKDEYGKTPTDFISSKIA